jgi:cysteine desulfurase
MKRPLYLDHHATTPVDPTVLQAMLPYFSECFGNASSRSHAYGWEADEAVETARAQVAALLGASPREIVFTSGATESNNLALKGTLEAIAAPDPHVITVATEHASVLETCRQLEERGVRVTRLPVGPDGRIDLRELESALTDRTVLVSVMQANNEIGVLQPLEEIARIVRARGARLHTDATQGVGLVPLDVRTLPVDLVSLSGHKIYGPKGVGALYVRQRPVAAPLASQLRGGSHEQGRRSGTLNVPGIVGLGQACAVARALQATEAPRLAALRDRLQERLTTALDGVTVNAAAAPRLPHNLSVSVAGVPGEILLDRLPDLAVSSGSACSSGSTRRPSHVLQALGLSEALAHATLRFGLGRGTTVEDVDRAADRVIEVVTALRATAPCGAL